MIKKVIVFFDKLEDKIRFRLSRWPIIYALVGALGIILLWKGVWETADNFPVLYGPVSILLGILILLATGLLVSFFIGDSIILSGFRGEKKLVEKTEKELKTEGEVMDFVVAELQEIEKDVEELKRRHS